MEALVELDEETFPGPTLVEVLGPHVEDGDRVTRRARQYDETVDSGQSPRPALAGSDRRTRCSSAGDY